MTLADIDVLRRTLRPNGRPTAPGAGARAAVAAVFRAGDDDLELLFIQRATHDRDPWSGHMALPGGRVDPPDASTRATAERETLEELGLDLTRAISLGSLDDVDGGRVTGRPLIVSAHCYHLEGERPVLTPNYEVDDVIWVPLATLLDPDRHIDHLDARSGRRFPGIQLDNPHQVVWGLTLRLLTDLFGRLRCPFLL